MNNLNTRHGLSAESGSLVRQGESVTGFDSLVLPGGKKATDVSAANLARILQAAGIPGVSSATGKSANMAAYAAHLDGIHQRAGDEAVAAWVASK